MQLKNLFQRGVETARFKADQLIRVNRVQSEIDQLRREIVSQRQKIADLTLELYKVGTLHQTELSAVCQMVASLSAQIETREGQITHIKAESLDGMPMAGPVGEQCPHCRSALAPGAEFCGNCGKPVPTETREQPDTTSTTSEEEAA